MTLVAFLVGDVARIKEDAAEHGGFVGETDSTNFCIVILVLCLGNQFLITLA